MTPDRMVQLSVSEGRATTEETAWLLNRIGELEVKVVALHEMIHEAEADSRAVLAGESGRTARNVLESYIIDGADACREYGPCPSCVAAAPQGEETDVKR